MTDAVVECDDALIEKYFNEGKVSNEELWHAFPTAIRTGHIVPVLHVTAGKDLGVRQLLDFLVRETPTPAGAVLRPAKGPDGKPGSPKPTDAFSAQGHEGQIIVVVPSKDLVMVRLGLFHGGAEAWNALGDWSTQLIAAFGDRPLQLEDILRHHWGRRSIER